MTLGAFRFPARVYPIVDTGLLGPRSPLDFAERLLGAGARMLQLRAKDMPAGELLVLARALQTRAEHHGALLIVNDRPDIAMLAGAGGVHLGQDDLPAEDARRLLGPGRVIGLSTHDVEQVRAATRLEAVDYVGFGPLHPTSSKANHEPCPGIAGLRQARAATELPIVAIGGLDTERAREALAAGADAVAMIGALIEEPEVVLRALLGA